MTELAGTWIGVLARSAHAGAGRVHHLQEAVAPGLRLERAAEAGGYGRYARLAHAAHRHALVLGGDQHGDAARPQLVVDGVGDLRRQSLLRLQPAREDLDDA